MGHARAGETPLRLAYLHSDLARKGPGLLLRDIMVGEPQVMSVVQGIAAARADVIVLSDVDYDHGHAALGALRDAVRAAGGTDYPHIFARRPNTGMETGLDLDGDGRLGGPGDAQGYGAFSGQGGMAVMSRYPLRLLADHGDLLWADVPDSLMIDAQGVTGARAVGHDQQRLASRAIWEIGVTRPNTPELTLMIFHATTPAFDGPEDRNGRRNHDEIRFWQHRLDGHIGPRPIWPWVILGTANLDPAQGQGRRAAIRGLLADPRLVDPQPKARDQSVYTADWGGKLGQMRVDYILPAKGIGVAQAQAMDLPKPRSTSKKVKSSRHRLILVDLVFGADGL